jgi:hypothetical protein
MTLTFCVGVKFPLVDTSEENGNFEVILGTQYVTNDELPPNLGDVFGTDTAHRGRYHPIRLNLKKGSLWVQDGRAFHRGIPNQTMHATNYVWHSAFPGYSAGGCMSIPRNIFHETSGKAYRLTRSICCGGSE